MRAEGTVVDDPVTVVVPCAGRGTRLGLPFPKELLPTGQGQVAIDGVFDLLAPHRGNVRVIMVIDQNRWATVSHVRCRYPDWTVAFVHQHPAHPELVGAVLSARRWYSSRVLVLLPDQWLTSPVEDDPIGRAANALEAHPACLLVAAEDDEARIAIDGAVRTRRDANGSARVVAVVDKPGTGRTEGFNAVWFGFGFTAHTASAVLDQMAASKVGPPDTVLGGPVGGCPAIEVPPFTDLGTWPAVTGHWARMAGVR